MRKFTIWLLWLLTSAQPAIAQIDTAKLDLDTLKNGLQLMIYSDSSLQMAATRLSFLAGARYDRADQAGVAYLSHHLIQNELAAPRSFSRDPAMVNYLTGGSVSAYFSEDISTYCQQFLPEEMKLALAVEARRLSPVQYASERISSWRNAIAQQEEQGDGPGQKNKYQQFIQQSVFPAPYNRPLQGFADLLQASTNDEIKDFVKKHYTGNRAVLVIVSPVPVDTVRKLVNGFFRGWPQGGELPGVDSLAVMLPDSIHNDTFYTEGLVLPVATYLFPLPPATDTLFGDARSVATLLFAGRDALVTNALRKKGLRIADAGFDLKMHSGGSVVAYSVVPKLGQPIDSITLHLDSLLHHFSREEVNDRSFYRWQAEMQSRQTADWQQPEKIASELMFMKISGSRPLQFFQRRKKMAAISKASVRKIVQSCFAADRKKVFIALDSDR